MTQRYYGTVSPPDGAEIDFSHPLSDGLAMYICFENRPIIYRPDYADRSVVLTPKSGCVATARGLYLNSGANDYITFPGAFTNPSEGTILANLIEGQGVSTAGPYFDVDTSRTLLFPRTVSNQISLYTDGYETDFATINAWASGDANTVSGAYRKSGNYHKIAQNGAALTAAGTSGSWGSNSPGTNAYISARITANERHAATWKSFGLWRTAMSPTDLAWITAEPYAIFQYSPRRYYSIVSAASFKAAWARRANVLISPGLK